MKEELASIMRREDTVGALEALERRTAPLGLRLTREECLALAEGRERALTDTGRVEFGGGILLSWRRLGRIPRIWIRRTGRIP